MPPPSPWRRTWWTRRSRPRRWRRPRRRTWRCCSWACRSSSRARASTARTWALPRCQLELVKRILQVQKNVAVVLHNGAPVELPFADDVPAILEAYLAGQAAGGGAVVDLLFGAVSPCGKLAETFPLRLEDTPRLPELPRGWGQRELRRGHLCGLPLLRQAQAARALPLRPRPHLHHLPL